MAEDPRGGEPFTGFGDRKQLRGERGDGALGPPLPATQTPSSLEASDAAWEGGKGSGCFLVVNSPDRE